MGEPSSAPQGATQTAASTAGPPQNPQPINVYEIKEDAAMG